MIRAFGQILLFLLLSLLAQGSIAQEIRVAVVYTFEDTLRSL